MGKRIMILVLLVMAGFSLSGCATSRKNNELEMQGLRNQVAALESQLSAKDEELNSLKSAVKAPEEQSMGKATEIKQRPKVKEIQTALKNAGYEPGKIDGKIGKQTIEAIKAFQGANNLPVDGKVGKRTWSILRDYLDKKVK
ncbi:MAG: peptidoglycan-binding protein [Candidatus Omnitrophica bacterium]|nr:peptidoglycan-binding protein [Candidatus Omnitrophota bacterium]